MKKLLLIFGLLMMSFAATFGQNSSSDHTTWSEQPDLQNYTVQFRAIDATCYNNGQIEFFIADAQGNPIDETTFSSLNLSSFNIVHRGVVLDTFPQHTPVIYTFPKTRVQMETGTFDITMQCVHEVHQVDGVDTFYLVTVDTTTQLTVNLNYTVPIISPLTVNSNDGVMLGNIPTLTCTPTGRVQINITGGRYPYNFVVVNHFDPTDTLRVVSFDTNQSFGTVDSLADYLNYYSFDTMPAGEWDFYLVDGCGYEMPRATQIVNVIDPPELDSIGVYASSGNIHDTNRLKIRVYLGNNLRYYLQRFTPEMEYRFLVPAEGNREALAGDNTPWEQFPPATSDQVTITSDVIRAHDYCELRDRDLILQVRLNQNELCEPYIMSDTFHYFKPDSAHFVQDKQRVEMSRVGGEDCGSATIYRHDDHFNIRYSPSEPNHVNPHDDHGYIRYHFTYPLVWIYDDGNDHVYKTDTIYSDIGQRSYFNLSDLPDTTLPINMTLYMHLVDSTGCDLYRGVRQIIVDTNIQAGTSAKWRSNTKATYCCLEGTAPRTISLFEEFGSDFASYDNLTVELVSSPNNNKYNFSAVYHAATQSWSVTKTQDLVNTADIAGATDGKSITMTEQCLPAGYYMFEVTNMPCLEGMSQVNVLMQGYYNVRVDEEPAFQIVDNCSNKFIKFTAGQFVLEENYRNSDNTPGLREYPLTTRFRLVDGPVGGYDRNDNTIYYVGDSVLISMPTDSTHPYVIETTAYDSKNRLCEKYVTYDTIYYNGSTVMFDFALAFICNEGDSVGTAYVRAWNGNPDYYYQLYSDPDLGGVMLGDTTLGPNEVAVFPNIPLSVGHQLSCRVEDRCEAAFKLNFPPQTMAEIQKTWFDGGMSVITTCEGSTIQVHVLRVGDVFKYAWFKNNDTVPFTVSAEPMLFVPRGPNDETADTATYHVKIFQTGCADMIEDSVTIYPKKSPYVVIDAVDSVCPGQDVEVSFTPKAFKGDSVSFTIVFETRDDQDIRSYRVPSGFTLRDTFTANSEAKVYPLVVEDDECGYPVADPGDTIYIHVSKKIINPCHIITTNDNVCYGDDAILSAYCTEDQPLVIRWYSDFEMKNLLDTFLVTTTGDTSYHPLPGLQERTIRYVSVYKPGWCPSVNNNPNNVVNMTPDTVIKLRCTDAYLFYDDGGANGDYAAGQDADNIKQVFINTESDQPLTIHFDSLNLSSTAHMFFFSSADPITSKLFYELNSYSSVPDIIVSPNDTLMIYFIPGDIPSWGWRATVQPSPGVAIADVMLPEVEHYYDRVCQRSDPFYDNQEILSLGIAAQDTLALARTHAGTYVYTKYDTTAMGCDSSSILTFMVSSPPMREMLAVTTSEIGYQWHGTTYYEAGVYAYNIPDARGCDFLEVLNLIVIEVTNNGGDVCYGDSVNIGVTLVTNDTAKPKSNLIEERHAVGDVLCRKGNVYRVMRPDKYVTSEKDSGWVVHGVVVYVDPNDNSHGKAIALVDASTEKLTLWANNKYKAKIHAASQKTNYLDQRLDMKGYENTIHMRSDAIKIDTLSSTIFKEAAPAAYCCYYYDPDLLGTGGSPSGWYLPSCGEWYACYAYRNVINQTLTLLEPFGAAILTEVDREKHDVHYWTSTEVNDDKAVCVNGRGQIVQHHPKDRTSYPYKIRAMINY